MFLLGILAAVLGNAVIGVGQVLQKLGINRTQFAAHPGLPTSFRAIRSLDGQPTGSPRSRVQPSFTKLKAKQSLGSDTAINTGFETASLTTPGDITGISSPTSPALKSPLSAVEKSASTTRFHDRYWIGGVALTLLGEIFGNWAALSFLSPAAVTPLGAVAVIVNAVLARRWLSETITEEHKRGYVIMAIGVASILFVAPRPSDENAQGVASTAAEMVAYMTTVRFYGLFGGLLFLITVLAYVVLLIKESLVGYVAIASCFGSLTVMASKTLLILFARLAYEARQTPSPISSTQNATLSALDSSSSHHAIHSSSSHGTQPDSAPTYALVGLTSMLIVSVIGQETAKQTALGKYPATTFQPLFYASYLSCVSLSGVFLFKELPEGGVLSFILFFSLGVALVFRGSMIVQSGGSVPFSHLESAAEKKR